MSRANPIRRPPLARSKPIRHFAGVFGARPTATVNDRSARPSVTDKGDPAGERPRERGATNAGSAAKKKAPAPGAAVSRGVNAGYRVIEEYLRQGQEFARTLWPGSASAGAGTPDAPLNMTERLIRSASDLAGLFSEFLQTFSLPTTLPPPGSTPIPDFGIERPRGAGAASAAGGRASGAAAGVAAAAGIAEPRPTGAPPAPAAETAAVSVDLRSRRRAEVTVNLRPGAWSGALHVHDLRPQEGAARLTGVTATGVAADRRVVVAADIPNELPAGTYSGLIVGADTNLPQGSVAIRIFAGEGGQRSKGDKPAPRSKPAKTDGTPKARSRRVARASK